MLNLNKGDIRELVFVDEPHLDLHVVQEQDSRLRVFLLNFHSADNLLHIDHLGTGCQTEIYALACLQGSDQVHTHTRMHHDVGHGESNQVIKFVLSDQAQGDFLGELKIKKDAQKVAASQSNKNLLLSPKAQMTTRPQLEIYADDVKASHGASTGQLDESALFYMQQRGLSAHTARRMLIGAFMKDILLTMSDTERRDQLLETIYRVVEQG